MTRHHLTPDRGDAPARRIGVAQILTLATALVLIGVGIAGFFVTDLNEWDDLAHHATGDELLWFELNPLHNIVHLVLGAFGVLAWLRLRPTIAYGVLLAVAYGAALVFGLAAIGEAWNVLSLNAADNWLHFGLMLLGVTIALIGSAELRSIEEADGEIEIDLREYVPDPAASEPMAPRTDVTRRR